MTNRLFDLHRPFSLSSDAQQSKDWAATYQTKFFQSGEIIQSILLFKPSLPSGTAYRKPTSTSIPFEIEFYFENFTPNSKYWLMVKQRADFWARPQFFTSLCARYRSESRYLLYLRTTRINQNGPCTSIRLTASESNKTTEMCSIFQLNWICTSLALAAEFEIGGGTSERVPSPPTVGGSIHHSFTAANAETAESRTSVDIRRWIAKKRVTAVVQW